MTLKMDRFSDAMLARYFTSYFAAWDIYRSTVNAYERRKLDSGVSMQERNDIEVELLWLHGEHAKLMQKRTAFLRGALAINRPSREQADRLQELSKKVDALTDAAACLEALTEISLEATEIMASIHNEDFDPEEEEAEG